VSRASVVTLYLNAEANLIVRPVLERQLASGTRVVSRNFTMGDWLPDESEILEEAPWGCDTLYLWVVRGSAPVATGARSEREPGARPTA
jgi:hypothetical protein